MKNRLNFNQSIKIFPTDTRVLYLERKVEEQFNLIKKDFKKWSSIINIDNEEDFESIRNEFLVFFSVLKFHKDRESEKKLGSFQIPYDGIENFKETILKEWKKKSSFLFLFNEYKNIKIQYRERKNNAWGFNQLLAKDIFNSQNLLEGQSFASKLNYSLNDQICNAILENNKSHDATLVINAIDDSIFSLKQKGIEPNLIIIGSRLIFHRTGYKEREFLFDYFDKRNQDNDNEDNLGIYKDIPVYKDKYIKNKIIVCNFNDAFELEITEKEGWLGKQLFFSLEEMDDKKAKAFLDENPDWKKDNNKLELTEEEAIIRVKNNLHFRLFYNAKLNIKNKKAYEIISFK